MSEPKAASSDVQSDDTLLVERSQAILYRNSLISERVSDKMIRPISAG